MNSNGQHSLTTFMATYFKTAWDNSAELIVCRFDPLRVSKFHDIMSQIRPKTNIITSLSANQDCKIYFYYSTRHMVYKLKNYLKVDNVYITACDKLLVTILRKLLLLGNGCTEVVYWIIINA